MARWIVLIVALAPLFTASGCLSAGRPNVKLTDAIGGPLPPRGGQPMVTLPDDTVPRELNKVTLPEYVIEPPDVLRIEAVIRKQTEDPDTKKKVPGDELLSLPLQPVWGEYAVRPDGTIYLGVYGQVQVAGYTLSQAAAAVRETLAKQAFAESSGLNPEYLLVVLDVTQYNSKKFYVILDGGGNGEQVIPLSITGNETVLDALAAVNGLPPVANKRNIWVARRTPHPNQPEQILPVDWVAITQHGIITTNWQIMPGDRVYVKAQRLVSIDNALARLLTPVERIFGVTILGASTVNQIQGRGVGFGNTGF